MSVTKKDAPVVPVVRAYAETLRRERLHAGLSQVRLAETAGISLRYVAALEAGTYQPTITVMLAVAQAMGLTLTQMVGAVEASMAAEVNAGRQG